MIDEGSDTLNQNLNPNLYPEIVPSDKEYDGTAWTQVNTDGFGDTENYMTSSMIAYKRYLYVGTVNVKTGTEVWEYDGTTWTQVNTDGFGDITVL